MRFEPVKRFLASEALQLGAEAAQIDGAQAVDAESRVGGGARRGVGKRG